MRRRADGSGVNEPVLPEGLLGGDPDVTPDGRLLVFSESLGDIWGLDVAADTAFAIVVDDVIKTKPAVSPDGRFVVYVQGNPCGSIQVSAVYGSSEPSEIATRGCFPVWTNDGSYIYYQDESTVSRVPVTTEPVFNKLGTPEEVYTAEIPRPVPSDGGLFFDVATDGTLYVSHASITEEETHLIWVVVNWFEELNRLAPRSE
jgi:Tol biopolymer transport system component